MNNEKSTILTEAEAIFGTDVVETVVALAEMSDPDGAWAQFQDQGMDEHVECVEFIYFEN